MLAIKMAAPFTPVNCLVVVWVQIFIQQIESINHGRHLFDGVGVFERVIQSITIWFALCRQSPQFGRPKSISQIEMRERREFNPCLSLSRTFSGCEPPY